MGAIVVELVEAEEAAHAARVNEVPAEAVDAAGIEPGPELPPVRTRKADADGVIPAEHGPAAEHVRMHMGAAEAERRRLRGGESRAARSLGGRMDVARCAVVETPASGAGQAVVDEEVLPRDEAIDPLAVVVAAAGAAGGSAALRADGVGLIGAGGCSLRGRRNGA